MLLILVMVMVTQEKRLLDPDLLSIQSWAKLTQLMPKRIFHTAFEWSCRASRDRLSSLLPLESGERREALLQLTDTISFLTTSDLEVNIKLGKMNVDDGPFQRMERFQWINKDARSDGTPSLAYCGGCQSLGNFHLTKSLWTAPWPSLDRWISSPIYSSNEQELEATMHTTRGTT